MLKKILGIAFVIALITLAVVQAIDKDSNEDQIISQPTNQSIPAGKIPGIDIGLEAPDFEIKTLDGKTVKLSDFQGQKVMLNFWATWCPPCKAEMPDMQKFYKEEGEHIQILAVNIDPEYDVAGFVKEMMIDFPILLDEDDEVMNAYQILTIPTTFFIDEKGIIQNKFMGAMTLKKMREYLKTM